MSENRIPKPGYTMLSIGPHPTVALVDGWTRYPYRLSRRNPEDPRSPRFISLPEYLTVKEVPSHYEEKVVTNIYHGNNLVGTVQVDKHGNQSIIPAPMTKFLLGEPLGNGIPLTL